VLQAIFTDFAHEGPLDSEYAIEHDVMATFRLEQEGMVLFEEPMVAIVELASQLVAWLEYGIGHGVDFRYEAEGYPDIMFSFRASGPMWEPVGDQTGQLVTAAELANAIKEYVERVRVSVREEAGLDVAPLLVASRYGWRYGPGRSGSS
jgi:hypothetical protein